MTSHATLEFTHLYAMSGGEQSLPLLSRVCVCVLAAEEARNSLCQVNEIPFAYNDM